MTVAAKKKLTAAEVLARIQERGVIYREAEVIGVNVDERTAELAFSSEAEVSRWFGVEVLSHNAEAVDLSRLNNGGAVLDCHNWSKQIGVVESARLDSDRKGRAEVRFSRNTGGEEMLQDIADRIKRHVSVGYFVKAIKLLEEREDVDVYVVTRWQPYEISIVPVPADVTVGVGRSADIPPKEHQPEPADTDTVPPTRGANHSSRGSGKSMNEKITRDASGNLVRAKVDGDGNIVEVLDIIERAGDDAKQARKAGAGAERERVRSITDMANQYGQVVEDIDGLARTALAEGHAAEQFQRALLDGMEKRASKPLNEQLAAADVGLGAKEVRNYSIMRVIRALLDPTDKRAQRAAAFEFEASEAARANQSTDSDRFVIPTDVLRSAVRGQSMVRAPLSSGTTGGAASGGNLIATELQPGSFIDILRNATTIMRRGRTLGGLVGNIDIPKKIAGTQGYWLGAEDDDAAETGAELGQIGMTPKTVAAFTEFTRKMVQQSSMDIEALLRADLAEGMALTIDKAGYYGTGADGQPLGIANVTGINAVALAATDPTFKELVAMETAVSADNALVDNMSYVGGSGFRGHAKTTLKFDGVAGTLWEPGNQVNGYSTEITNQITTGDVFFNNFADLLIGLWGGLELHVDPYSNSKKGRIRIITFQDVDFAHRRTESFCLGRKAVTP